MASEKVHYDLFTIVAIFLLLLAVFLVYFPLASPVVLGLTLAVVLHPLNKKLCERFRESLSAGLVTLAAATFLVVLVIVVMSFLLSGGGMMIDMIKTIVSWLGTLLPGGVISGSMAGAAINQIITSLKAVILPIISSFTGIIFYFIIFFLSVFLFLLKGPRVYEEIMTSLPTRLKESVGKISGVSTNTLYAIYIVMVEVAILTTIIALPIFYLLGFPAYIQISIMCGLAQFVPFIGPLIVIGFLVIYQIASGNIAGALIMIFIVYPVVFFIPGTLVKSKLMGNRVAIHPILLMVGIIGGISIMGIPGLILGPLFIALLISGYKILIDQVKMVKEANETGLQL
ncbi:MAG: AI-2E family transporter [Methanoregulaceae archaeon]|nr:AI-2E family transporter [Methanoregulaceae archaeon]